MMNGSYESEYMKYRSKYLTLKRFQQGGNWRCIEDLDNKRRLCVETNDPTVEHNVYPTKELCHNDCEVLPLEEGFQQVVPEEFEMRIEQGGDLYDEFMLFSLNPPQIHWLMTYIGSRKGPELKKIIDIALKGRNINSFITEALSGHPEITKWTPKSIDLLKTIPTDNYEIIGIPLIWNYSQRIHEFASHVVTGIADTRTKVLYIIDSNIDYSVNIDLEESLYRLLVDIEGSKLNGYSIVHSADLECPVALQELSKDRSCQTWQIYITLLSILNKNLPKKELLHITSLWDKKNISNVLKQFLFFIWKELERHPDLERKISHLHPSMSYKNIVTPVLSDEHYRYIETISVHFMTLVNELDEYQPLLKIGKDMKFEEYGALSWIGTIIEEIDDRFHFELVRFKEPHHAFVELLLLLLMMFAKIRDARDMLESPIRINQVNKILFEHLRPIVLLCIDVAKPRFEDRLRTARSAELPYLLEIMRILENTLNDENIFIISHMFFIIMVDSNDISDEQRYLTIDMGLRIIKADDIEQLRRILDIIRSRLDTMK